MRVLKTLVTAMDMQNEENSSVAFTVPLGHLAGLNIEELHKFEHEIENLL